MTSGKSKLGRFLIFISLILLVIFFATDQAKHPSYGYFCIGLVLLILGGSLVARGHQPPAESARFRTVRRWREQLKQQREERKKKPFEH